jgi:hypothetical protein
MERGKNPHKMGQEPGKETPVMARNRRSRQEAEVQDTAQEDEVQVDEAVELTTDMSEEDLPELTGEGEASTPGGRGPMPLERRERISNTLKAHWEGKDGPMKGKTHSEETRAKISESLRKSRESGELEGLTPEERVERNKQRRYAYNKQRNARIREEKRAAREAERAAAGEAEGGAEQAEEAAA